MASAMYDDFSEEEEIVAMMMCNAALAAQNAVAKRRRRKRRWWVRPCLRSREVAGHANRLMPELRAQDEEYYRDFVRMPPRTFDTLLELLQTDIAKQDTNFRNAIAPSARLAMTLRFLAAGHTLRSLSFDFLVGRSTASLIIADVCKALWRILKPLYIASPKTADEWIRVAAEFEERWDFPHCIGAIDGKHINIECPANSGSLDRNYKGGFSKSLLAVSDAQYRFLCVEHGHHGSESDGGIFSCSTLQERLIEGSLAVPPPSNVGTEGLLPYYFVGDEAFPLKAYMMRPYPRRSLHETCSQPSPKERRIFNYRLSRARRVVENAFGIMAQKWRILRRPFRAKEENIHAVVGACVVLHNFLLKESATSAAAYCPPGLADSEDWEGRLTPGSWRQELPSTTAFVAMPPTGCNAARYAQAVRNRLCHHFATVGQLPWQDRMISGGLQ